MASVHDIRSLHLGQGALVKSPAAAEQLKSERKGMMNRAERRSPYRPLICSMLLVGTLFNRVNSAGLRPRIPWTLIYHACILLLLWGNVVRFFTTYMLWEKFGPNLVGKILLHTFVGKGAVCASACTFMSLKREKVWLAFWQYQDRYGCPDGVRQVAHRRSKVGVIVCIATIAFALTNYVYRCIMQPDDIQNLIQFSLFSDSDPDLNIPFLAVVCICVFYAVSATCFALTCLVVLCLDVRDLFKHLTSDLANEVKVDDIFQGDLEYYRRRHEDVCGIVMHLDEIFSFVTLSVYVINIPIVCLIIYVLVINDWKPGEMDSMFLFNIPLIVYCFCEMMIVTAVGTMVHRAYFAFLARLSEGHIGLSGWRLFYINKQTVKTVMLMIIGYAAILLKFGNREIKASTSTTTTSPEMAALPGIIMATIARSGRDTPSE